MEHKFWAHGGMMKTAKAIWQDLEVVSSAIAKLLYPIALPLSSAMKHM